MIRERCSKCFLDALGCAPTLAPVRTPAERDHASPRSQGPGATAGIERALPDEGVLTILKWPSVVLKLWRHPCRELEGTSSSKHPCRSAPGAASLGTQVTLHLALFVSGCDGNCRP